MNCDFKVMLISIFFFKIILLKWIQNEAILWEMWLGVITYSKTNPEYSKYSLISKFDHFQSIVVFLLCIHWYVVTNGKQSPKKNQITLKLSLHIWCTVFLSNTHEFKYSHVYIAVLEYQSNILA